MKVSRRTCPVPVCDAAHNAYRGLADTRLRAFLPNPLPYPPCRVPLLLRGLLIGNQNPVDELHHRPQTRMASYWLLPLRRNRTYQGLPNHPPMNPQLPGYSLDRPGPVDILPSDRLK